MYIDLSISLSFLKKMNDGIKIKYIATGNGFGYWAAFDTKNNIICTGDTYNEVLRELEEEGD